jgi:hypothetical protein
MRRLMSTLLICAALTGGALSLAGCIVVPPRPHHQRVWISGYWAPQHVWVGGHWGHR